MNEGLDYELGFIQEVSHGLAMILDLTTGTRFKLSIPIELKGQIHPLMIIAVSVDHQSFVVEEA